MSAVSHQSEYAVNLAGGLADAGVEVAFISPGSRNTPLTLAIGNDPRITDVSVRDERSAGFAALGYAKATGIPAAMLCTSGSAAAHYLPAIVEANQSSTPLIALTADRPLRLRGTGAPQTMDQADLYGSHAKTYIDLDASDPSSARGDAIGLVDCARATPMGVAHGNIPFDTPLAPTIDIRSADPRPTSLRGKRQTDFADFSDRVAGRNVMIVVGGRRSAELSDVVANLARGIGAPVFADPQSNITGPNVLRHGDLVVAARSASGEPIALACHAPDVVLRLGPIPTSMAMWMWLEESGVEQVLIDPSPLADPLDSATVTIKADPIEVLKKVRAPATRDRTFVDAWLAMDEAVGVAVDKSMQTLPFPNEPAIAGIIASSVPDDTILFVGSSRPIRDLDAFGIARSRVDVIANRGVNGIDGAISTGLGASLSGKGTTVYIGDVTALHDISALSEVARIGAPLRIVVVNNDGGGIFSFLPQARTSTVSQALFDRHFGTPHGLRVSSIAKTMGLPARTVATRDALAAAVNADVSAPELIEIITDRSENVGYHRLLGQAATTALGC